jgi:hypothetical protein
MKREAVAGYLNCHNVMELKERFIDRKDVHSILAELLKEEVSHFLLVCYIRAFHFWKTVISLKLAFHF